MTNLIPTSPSNQSPPYELLSPITTVHYISGRLSQHFKKYIPVVTLYVNTPRTDNTIKYDIDLKSVYGVIVPIHIPISEEYSISSELIARPTLSDCLIAFIIKIEKEHSHSA